MWMGLHQVLRSQTSYNVTELGRTWICLCSIETESKDVHPILTFSRLTNQHRFYIYPIINSRFDVCNLLYSTPFWHLSNLRALYILTCVLYFLILYLFWIFGNFIFESKWRFSPHSMTYGPPWQRFDVNVAVSSWRHFDMRWGWPLSAQLVQGKETLQSPAVFFSEAIANTSNASRFPAPAALFTSSRDRFFSRPKRVNETNS